MSFREIDLADLKSALVVALVGEKGGIGKSTTVINLAAYIAKTEFKDGEQRRRPKVAVIDVDPQGSSLTWAGLRNLQANQGVELSDITIMPANGAGLTDTWKAQAKNFDFMFFDTPGSTHHNVVYSLMLTNIALLPTRATTFDLATWEEVHKAITVARMSNPKLECLAFLNQIEGKDYAAKAKMVAGLIEKKELINLHLLREKVTSYSVTENSSNIGVGVHEMTKGSNLSVARGQYELLMGGIYDGYLKIKQAQIQREAS